MATTTAYRLCYEPFYDGAAYVTGPDLPHRPAVYLERWCNEWWGVDCTLLVPDLAELLQTFYGFKVIPPVKADQAVSVDMHIEREYGNRPGGTGDYRALMADEGLHRDGLRQAMLRYVYPMSQEAEKRVSIERAASSS